MGAPENLLIKQTLLELTENKRLFRINSGLAWSGEVIRNTDGYLVLTNPRPFHGAPKGFPDLFGWTTIKITEDMIGEVVAVATGVEVKATGKLTDKQLVFANILKSMGGIHKIVKH